MKIVAVLGLSGVGKSTLVEKASEWHAVLHLKASDLIKARQTRPQSSEQLRQGPVLDNQAVMLAEFTDRIAIGDTSTVVFDGHSVIDTPSGLVEIPLSVFERINPGSIIFVEDEPAAIWARRIADTGHVRPNRSAIQLARHQALAKTRAAYFAECLAVPFHSLASDDVTGLIALLEDS